MRSAERRMGVRGFLISWATRRATSLQAASFCSRARWVVSSMASTQPPDPPGVAGASGRTVTSSRRFAFAREAQLASRRGRRRAAQRLVEQRDDEREVGRAAVAPRSARRRAAAGETRAAGLHRVTSSMRVERQDARCDRLEDGRHAGGARGPARRLEAWRSALERRSASRASSSPAAIRLKESTSTPSSSAAGTSTRAERSPDRRRRVDSASAAIGSVIRPRQRQARPDRREEDGERDQQERGDVGGLDRGLLHLELLVFAPGLRRSPPWRALRPGGSDDAGDPDDVLPASSAARKRWDPSASTSIFVSPRRPSARSRTSAGRGAAPALPGRARRAAPAVDLDGVEAARPAGNARAPRRSGGRSGVPRERRARVVASLVLDRGGQPGPGRRGPCRRPRGRASRTSGRSSAGEAPWP